MRIIYHLGAYKTATSTLQNLFFANHHLLKEKGILYPLTGLAKEDTLGRRHFTFVYRYSNGKTSVALPGRLWREIQESDCNTVVLSSEAWSNPRCLSHLAHLIAEFRSLGIQNQIGILALRNLAEYQVSHYREFTVNQGNKLPFRSYIATRRPTFDYLTLLSIYMSLFSGSLRVIKYKKESSFLATQFNLFNLDISLADLSAVADSNSRRESALDVEIIRLLNLKNYKGVDRSMLHNRVKSYLSCLGDYADENFTERFEGDLIQYPSGYLDIVGQLSGLSCEVVSELYDSCESALQQSDISERTESINALVDELGC